MYAQMLTYRVTSKTEEAWQVESELFARIFASLPGLIRTLWFADAPAHVYGTLLFWSNEQAREDFVACSAFRRITRHPDLRDIALQDFDVWDYHARLTARLMVESPAIEDTGEEIARTA